jgi:hypothetical protein
VAARSFYDRSSIPSALISDGVVTVPLWAVTVMTLSESYHLPPIGGLGARAVAVTHDDAISLTAVLVGADRFAWKVALENLAEAGKRGSALEVFADGAVAGLILVTSMTIRTDMQIQTLTFSASATRRDALEVSLSMIHAPRPGALHKLLDVSSLAVAALADWAR